MEEPPRPLTDKELREALLDCYYHGGIKKCRALIDATDGNLKWAKPASALTRTAWFDILEAIKAGNQDDARSLILEWRSDPDVQEVVDVCSLGVWSRSHVFARPLVMCMARKWRDLANLILESGAYVTEPVMVEMVDRMPVDFSCQEVQGILEDIVSCGWDVNAPLYSSPSGPRFPLIFAGKRPILFNWLLDHGACPDIETTTGVNPVTLCATHSNLPGMQKLLALGVTPHTNALHLAIRHTRPDNLAMLSLLIDHGADVNAVLEIRYHNPMRTGCYMAKSQTTPLHEAASYDDYEAAKLLVENGADPYIRKLVDGEEGLSGLDAMRVSRNEDIVRLADEKFGPPTQEEIDVARAIRARPYPGTGVAGQDKLWILLSGQNAHTAT